MLETEMAKLASEIIEVSNTLHIWQLYDASVKADLFSTALKTENGILFVDPVPLAEEILHSFVGESRVIGIAVTNANHARAALHFSDKFNAPIFAGETTFDSAPALFRALKDADRIAEQVSAISIEGAAPGEIALHHSGDGGTLIMGDALINFEPYGFTFLPAKYCTDAKEMRRSLHRLLDYKFERVLFAHGQPLMHSAHKKLEALLQAND